MSFALFVFALINSGLIPLVVKLESADYFFMAISFLAGFSEHFARDIVTTIEDKIINATKDSNFPTAVVDSSKKTATKEIPSDFDL